MHARMRAQRAFYDRISMLIRGRGVSREELAARIYTLYFSRARVASVDFTAAFVCCARREALQLIARSICPSE